MGLIYIPVTNQFNYFKGLIILVAIIVLVCILYQKIDWVLFEQAIKWFNTILWPRIKEYKII